MSLNEQKVLLDYQKFKACVQEGDPLGFVGGAPIDEKTAVTEGFMYNGLLRRAKKIDERIKNIYGSYFLFLVMNRNKENGIPDIMTANNLIGLLNKDQYYFMYIGDKRNQKEVEERLEYINAVLTVSYFLEYQENSINLYGRQLSDAEIYQRLNTTKAKVQKQEKLIKEKPMWILKTNEFTDANPTASKPTWFTELLSRIGAREHSFNVSDDAS